ncbi:Vacuolar protein-sorting-associated protein 28 [Loxospora ochrophaea]|nr:Vacuolar protein-sorting-associated protein 28 [Loxospora ochrophaea]
MYTSQRPLPYAPTPYSYTPNPTLSATINLDEEVRLPPSDLNDSLSEIYSIITTLDGLEKAYIKDSITESEYSEVCTRLLKQYNSILSDEGVMKAFVGLDEFKREWDIDLPRATERLRTGLPATALSTPTPSTPHPHSHPPSSTSHHPPPAAPHPTPASILLATENFITFLDALKLSYRSKDQLHPLLSEVITSVNAVTAGARDFEGRGKIVAWLIRLNGMRATEELGEEEARECLFEMEGAYRGFKGVLD